MTTVAATTVKTNDENTEDGVVIMCCCSRGDVRLRVTTAEHLCFGAGRSVCDNDDDGSVAVRRLFVTGGRGKQQAQVCGCLRSLIARRSQSPEDVGSTMFWGSRLQKSPNDATTVLGSCLVLREEKTHHRFASDGTSMMFAIVVGEYCDVMSYHA